MAKKARSIGAEAAGSKPEPPRPPKGKKKPSGPPSSQDYLDVLHAMKGVEDEDFSLFGDELVLSSVKEWLPTGCIAIDRLTGGGWPVTRITEVAAWEQVGKSTLLDQSIGLHQQRGGVAALIDTENARDRAYSVSLGIDPKKLLVLRAETVEQVFDGIDKMIVTQEKIEASSKDAPPLLIVWDSIGGTPTKAEREGDADDKHVSSAAKVIKMNLRRTALRIQRLRVALVFTNHFYESMGNTFSPLKTYGGNGIKYFASLRVWLTRTGNLYMGERVVGHKVEAKLKKTRITAPRPPAECGLIYGAGFHNAFTLWEWGKGASAAPGHKWIVPSGAWSYLYPPDGTGENGQPWIGFQHTYLGLGEVLTRRPDVYAQMAEAYKREEFA